MNLKKMSHIPSILHLRLLLWGRQPQFSTDYSSRMKPWALKTSLPGFQSNVSLFTDVLGVAEGKGKWRVWGVMINTHPFVHQWSWALPARKFEHELAWNVKTISTSLKRHLSCTIRPFLPFLIYLFHRALQILVLPYAVQQQRGCAASLGKFPKKKRSHHRS